MDQSSANTEVRPKNSAECSARQHVTIGRTSAELRQKNSASLLRRFVPTAHFKLKSVYCRL